MSYIIKLHNLWTDLLKLSVDANILMTQILDKMKYELKGHISHLYVRKSIFIHLDKKERILKGLSTN